MNLYPDRSGMPVIATVTAQPKDDAFYSYTEPVDGIAPGTVLKTRNFHYHLFGFPTLLETTQLLYRSTSQMGKPTVNVTSIINAFKSSDATTKIALMTMNPAISPASSTLVSNLPSYYQKLRDLAASESVELFDNTVSWGTPDTTQIPDGVHPTVAAVRTTMVPNLVTAIGSLIT